MLVLIYRFFLVVISMFYITACGGGEGEDISTQEDIFVEQIRILPAYPLLKGVSIEEYHPKGLNFQYKAEIVRSDGSSIITSDEVSWAVSNENASITQSGILSTIETGSVIVRASIDNIFVEKEIYITEATLTAIQVTPASLSVAKGQQQQFLVQGVYSDKTSADITGMVSWNSSDATIATVSTTGLTTAIAPGTATITASFDGISSTASLVVTEATLTAIQVTPASLSVAKGQQQQFLVQGVYSDKTSADITGMVS
ncbi:Ig-like domain-containing protein, partial [Aeromonas sp.]|uniref:Ig-like domain-containing protein n=1 Tax=Aeromonas sp. TaxID=647 RepID=UPI00258B077F